MLNRFFAKSNANMSIDVSRLARLQQVRGMCKQQTNETKLVRQKIQQDQIAKQNAQHHAEWEHKLQVARQELLVKMLKQQTSNDVDQFSQHMQSEAKQLAVALQQQQDRAIQRNNLSVQKIHEAKQLQQEQRDQKAALRVQVATMEKKRSKMQVANSQEQQHQQQPAAVCETNLHQQHNFQETYFHMGIKPQKFEKQRVVPQNVPRITSQIPRKTKKINPMTSHVQLKMEQKRAMLEKEASAIISRERYQKVKGVLVKPITHTARDIEKGFETNFLH